jgi:hypothetical protein
MMIFHCTIGEPDSFLRQLRPLRNVSRLASVVLYLAQQSQVHCSATIGTLLTQSYLRVFVFGWAKNTNVNIRTHRSIMFICTRTVVTSSSVIPSGRKWMCWVTESNQKLISASIMNRCTMTIGKCTGLLELSMCIVCLCL